MLFTNEAKHGGNFKTKFTSTLKDANSLTIATGYFGASLIEELKPALLRLSKKKSGQCRILIGMIYHSGIRAKQHLTLTTLDKALRKINPNNGIYISLKEYHGKIYHIDDDVYLGSSNFSEPGFKSRWECTAKITDEKTQDATKEYLDFLFSQETTVELSEVDLKATTTPILKPSKLLEDYKVLEFPKGPVIAEMQIKLRVDKQLASSLNLYFDKGRKNKNGLYAPRPWYEVEITTSKEDREHECYPISELKTVGKNSRYGEFNAFIKEDDNVYKLKMTVASDYGKALATSEQSGGRQTLGRYIKGKLEASGYLKKNERITSEILDAYGRDYITLKRIDNKNYILEF
ncbi:MAG: NgoFVII family restriction endonuclease [Gammaproteobacteria bacterium]|nr:NgoFVII family restriction endonuclease [Gammaproteobacteria bacterium]